MRTQHNKSVGLKSSKLSHGFSLIELLIVVAVILIIAAIAIPNFLRSKMRANEAAAVSNLRNIDTANVVYSTTYGIGYAPALAALGGNPTIPDSTQAGLIDSVLSSGTKSGYIYTYAVTSTDTNGNVLAYSVNADPTVVGNTGDRHFYTDQSAIIRQNTTGVASATDPALQ
jgi:prepilin-type N-terminal cleavage/methylation domain-containing protein